MFVPTISQSAHATVSGRNGLPNAPTPTCRTAIDGCSVTNRFARGSRRTAAHVANINRSVRMIIGSSRLSFLSSTVALRSADRGGRSVTHIFLRSQLQLRLCRRTERRTCPTIDDRERQRPAVEPARSCAARAMLLTATVALAGTGRDSFDGESRESDAGDFVSARRQQRLLKQTRSRCRGLSPFRRQPQQLASSALPTSMSGKPPRYGSVAQIPRGARRQLSGA